MEDKGLFELTNEALIASENGKNFWNKFIQEHNIKNKELIVILDNENEDINYYTVGYLKPLQDLKKYSKITCLSSKIEDESLIEKSEAENIYYHLISQKELSSLKALYRLYKFSAQIVINTFEETSDANGFRLVDDAILEKDIVAIAILGLPSVPEKVYYK